MPVKERDARKTPGPAPAAGAPHWLRRLNDFGERHARAIITASTALLILTVLLFARYFYDRAMIERAELDLARADTVEHLKELKQRYASYPVRARITYRLAARYYQDNDLESARKEYQDFMSRFSNHPLKNLVERALASLEKNAKYEATEKPLLLKEPLLQSHPLRLPQARDPRLQWAPVPEPRPVVELDFGSGVVRAELFEDDAPAAVQHFVALCERKYFDGAALEPVNTDERLRTQPQAKGAEETPVPFEPTSRATEAHSLLMIRKEGAPENLPGRFEILLKPLPGLQDVTVFGLATEGTPVLKNLKMDDLLKSVRVLSKRSHPYEVPQRP